MKNFLKKHFYSVFDVYDKISDDYPAFYDFIRVFIVSILLVFTFMVFVSLV